MPAANFQTSVANFMFGNQTTSPKEREAKFNAMLGSYRETHRLMLDFCDSLEAKMLRYQGEPLSRRTTQQYEAVLAGIRKPEMKQYDGKDHIMFGAFPTQTGLTRMASMGLMVDARLNQDTSDILDNASLCEQVGGELARHNFNAWRDTQTDMADYHGISENALIANINRHLKPRDNDQDECRQERMAGYLRDIHALSNGDIAGPSAWDAFDPRKVSLINLSDGEGEYQTWLCYDRQDSDQTAKEDALIGPIQCDRETGFEDLQVERLRDAFYHGSHKHGLTTQTQATPDMLKERVRENLATLQTLALSSPEASHDQDAIDNLADRFFAHIGEPESMPGKTQGQSATVAAPAQG